MYPVMLNLKGRSCLVVGGGGIALRKIEGLLADGAVITVVAPHPIAAVIELAESGKVRLHRRAYRSGEVGNYALGFAATNDRRVNRQVFWDGENAGIWINVADDPDICSFHLPARVQRGALQLIVSSAGEAPFVVRRLRKLLESVFGPEWAEWIDAAGRFRRTVRKLNLSRSEEQKCYDRFFEETVEKDSLEIRVPSCKEQVSWVGKERSIKQVRLPDSRERSDGDTGVTGFVSLVGAGPGDVGLLTVRGHRRLLGADSIVYDHLAETVLPCDLPNSVELHPVGKRSGYHPVPQEEINSLLIRLASEGKKVVRLKGGDPFVFGRGGEEAEALEREGIPFEVIPCVTAATSVPAYAGIPVTHRNEVVKVSLITAHESRKKGGPQVRWDLLGPDQHSTLVGYMGVTSLPQVARRLIASGMDSNMPAAMIERGSTSCQKTVVSTLSKLPNEVKRKGLRPPAIFVIGPSVVKAKSLDWFTRRPLFGERLVLVTPSEDLGEALEIAGAEVVKVPLPLTHAARVVVDALPTSGYVFRSPDEVEILDDTRARTDPQNPSVAWCLGRVVAERARATGWIHVVELKASCSPAEVVEAVKSKLLVVTAVARRR